MKRGGGRKVITEPKIESLTYLCKNKHNKHQIQLIRTKGVEAEIYFKRSQRLKYLATNNKPTIFVIVVRGNFSQSINLSFTTHLWTQQKNTPQLEWRNERCNES